MLARLLEDDRDLLAGAGFWPDEDAEFVREGRRTSKAKRKERMRRLARDTDEGA